MASSCPSLSLSSPQTLTALIFFISFASHLSLLIATTTITTGSSKTSKTIGSRFTKIYAFGDSFTDTGNTRSASTGPTSFDHVSQLPYGITFFHHPTNRYSDGRLVIDFLAEALSLPYLPPYINRKADTSHGVNFAVAGSTAIDHDFFVRNNLTLNRTPQSLHTQLTWFNELLEGHGCGGSTLSAQCRAELGEALFWVGEIGANDYAYLFGSTVSQTLVQDLAINSVTGFLQELLKKGAKYIVVQGLPMTGCLSLAMTLAPPNDRDDVGCVRSSNTQSRMHNTALQNKLQELRRQHPDAIIVYADYFNAYSTVMKNPVKYGFKEKFKTCCGSGGDPYNLDPFATCGSPASLKACPNPAQFINWDGVHLTEAMYKTVAELFLHGGYTRPPLNILISHKIHGA